MAAQHSSSVDTMLICSCRLTPLPWNVLQVAVEGHSLSPAQLGAPSGGGLPTSCPSPPLLPHLWHPVQCSAHMALIPTGQDIFTLRLPFHPAQRCEMRNIYGNESPTASALLPGSFLEAHPPYTWLILARPITVQKEVEALPWVQARAEGPKELFHSSWVGVIWSYVGILTSLVLEKGQSSAHQRLTMTPSVTYSFANTILADIYKTAICQ